ncbi:hypothetical protein PIROE2DRAFT_12895 [Piromyces sp. E2]|nr:hypothetical protein PIROE2DRAFT_12895 [Piromyces sp. E2]|eukprot:OUM61176.1 hypothetical protein PIROE2DRAFT_12895 [Piromyces sp. E2]
MNIIIIGKKAGPKYGKITRRYKNLTKFFKTLKLGYSSDETVKRFTVNDYSDIMIGLDEVGDLDVLSNENYKSVKKQLLEEANRIIDMEPKFYNRVSRSIDHIELEFLMQYARDVETGKRGSELEPEWQWVKDISIVYTWINGTDDALLERKAKYNGGIKKADNRDRCIDELRYSLRSVYKFLPWHTGTIYFVTPGQTPVWLDTSNPRIKVIDQEDILPKYTSTGQPVNPSFNSFAIEWYLDRIPGVTEQFIQLNDEYFFRRPVHPSFFFYGGGEGYINNEKVRNFRSNGKSNNNNKKNGAHYMKRSVPEEENYEEIQDEEEHYVHGVKIDKDIQELVARELKNADPDKKRNVFLSKRNPIDVNDDLGEDDDDNVEGGNEGDDEGNIAANNNADAGVVAGDENEHGDENDLDDENIVGYDNDKGEYNYVPNEDGEEDEGNKKSKVKLDDGENPDNEDENKNNEEEYEEGEEPDNEDEGIGIISKNKNEKKLVLKNDDFSYNEDGSIKIFRTEKVPTRKPYINKYIYPNAARHYRFPNVYLSDKFITLGFEKSRETFENKNARWIDKFYGSMGMTNGVIAEDLEKSTLVNMLEHSPYVYNRDLFEMTRQRYAQYVDLVISHRFRTAMDFVPPYAQIMYLRNHASLPDFEKEFDKFYDSLYIHDVKSEGDYNKRTRSILKYGYHIVDFEIKNRMIRFGAVFDDLERNARFFRELLEHKTLIFFNLNDDYNYPEAADQFSQFMQFLYPEPSIYEKPGF